MSPHRLGTSISSFILVTAVASHARAEGPSAPGGVLDASDPLAPAEPEEGGELPPPPPPPGGADPSNAFPDGAQAPASTSPPQGGAPTGWAGYPFPPGSPPPPFQYPPIEDEEDDPPSAGKAYTKLGFGVPLTILGSGACVASAAFGAQFDFEGLSAIIWGPLLIGGLGGLGAGIPLWASGGRELARAEEKGLATRDLPATSELRVGAGSLSWMGSF